ncbi:ATP synthase F1 subunit delta [Wolbachia endosymbiont of Cruorifilaria tuberocauda]|uniref:ATP synthase F1 subunit delta n=1 Tax=Wolbachia endosymbiont of Cruorifilaria tuberocauda TaxID=1812111 RepID=UPI00158D59A6|nr:ATP synthase F1 subunit delta [Wolbachia endosymbiont of Cruorifilaria tuberocauda]QKX01716.1 ATP synthase F1 subunit delta [Wolbachia endosymbiont of Cruorifilaria tuberocauda]
MKKAQYINLISSYAKVLFYVAKNKLGPIKKEVQFLLDFFESRPEVFMYLSHPIISLTHKREVLLSIGRDLNESLVRFIIVILANRRSNLLLFILKKFLNLVRENDNELEVTIKSAEMLSGTDIKIITESLSSIGKIIKVDNIVDTSIIGGFVVKYGFSLIDVSLKSYLDRLVGFSKTEILKIRSCI